MATSKNANAKNAPKKDAKPATQKLEKINLQKFEFTPLEKGVRERNSIYNYPEQWKEKPFNKNEHGKEFRGWIRRTRDRIIISLIWGVQTQDEAKIKSAYTEWMKFYKGNYKLNDFSIASISENSEKDKISDRISKKDAITFLDFCKQYQSK